MLESEIKTLTESVQKLTAAVEAQTALFARFEAISKEDVKAKIEAKPADPEPKVAKAPKPKPEPQPEAEAEAEAPADAPAISRDDLQAKCMTIVRGDRTKRGAVEGLIAAYGGTLIRDVPEDKLAELAAKLDELA